MKSYLPYILLAVAFVFVLLASVIFNRKDYLLSNNVALVPTSTPTPTPLPNTAVSFMPYHNTYSNYDLFIPNNWQVVDPDPGQLEYQQFQAPDQSTFSLQIYAPTNLSLVQYLAKLDKASQTAWEGQPAKKVLSSQKITILNKIPAITRQESLLAAGFDAKVIYAKIGTRIVVFTAQPDNSLISRDFDQVVSTFKLLK